MNRLDKIGIASSLLCAIHCAILPVLLILFPIISLSFFVSETIELFFLISSLIIGIFSICFGIRIHKNWKIFALLSSGFVILLLGKIFHESYLHNNLSHNLFMAFGGCLVAFSHYLNDKLCKACKMCHHHE